MTRRSLPPLLAVALLLGLNGPVRAQEVAPTVGDRAPAVVVHDLDGQPVDLGTVLGHRPALLEWWASWCELCAALLPSVREAHRQFGDRVAFYGINVTVNQSPARVRRYLAEHQPPFITLYDDRGTSQRAYGVPTTSYVVIVDRSGTIVYTGSGGEQDLQSALARAVAAP